MRGRPRDPQAVVWERTRAASRNIRQAENCWGGEGLSQGLRRMRGLCGRLPKGREIACRCTASGENGSWKCYSLPPIVTREVGIL